MADVFDLPVKTDGRHLDGAGGFSIGHFNFAGGVEYAQTAARAINSHDALVDTLADLIEASTAEVNEKGAGGFLLARLTDARTALARARQKDDRHD